MAQSGFYTNNPTPIDLATLNSLVQQATANAAAAAASAAAAAATLAASMLKANNLSDVASVPTARTNLGLGTSAVQNVAFFNQTANNLSDVANVTTARGNLVAAKSGANTDLTSITPASPGTIDNMAIGGTTPLAAKVTTLTATAAVTLSPASANVVLSPTGTGVVTVNPATVGSIDNMVLGATTPKAATVTSMNGGQLAGQRNMIINGDMRIDQRNSGALTTPATGAYVIDRWSTSISQASKWSFGRIASATAGSAYALKAVVASAYTAVAADIFHIFQAIEGLNAAHLNWGTANAKTATVSGIINASVTGSYALAIRNGVGNRSYISLVTVSVANTDTPFSVTIPGDTTGTWASDNTIGVNVGIDLGSGSTYNAAAANTWSASNSLRTSAGVTLTATAGATVLLKDMQLEAGSTATPFERRSYGDELLLCQRYCPVFGGISGAALGAGVQYSGALSLIVISHPVTTRVPPTGVTVNNVGNFLVFANGAGVVPTTIAFNQSGTTASQVAVSSAGTVGQGAAMSTTNANAMLIFTGCEL